MSGELIIAFLVGLAFGMILVGLMGGFALFVHFYQKAVNEKEEIYGDEKNTESDRNSDD
tara:strand:- start:78 stop:254 length:177 start_codon:yes stop_codon:yes gene_type:complete